MEPSGLDSICKGRASRSSGPRIHPYTQACPLCTLRITTFMAPVYGLQ